MRAGNERRSRGCAIFALALGAISLISGSRSADAALGDCGQPQVGGPVATDALEILATAVGVSDCGGFDPCVCDANGSGATTASDALLVLRKAVGENLELVCPCTVTTTTTTLPGPVLTTELIVLTKREGSYTTADLAGTWDVNALGAGADNYWTRGSLTVKSDGKFTGTLHESGGPSDNISGRLAISSAGIITCSSGCGSDFGAALDSGKTVMVMTMTPEQGRATLLFITRRAANYAQANLTGTWQLNGLVSGPSEPFWNRGPLEIAANGAVTGSLRGSDGSLESFSPNLSLSSTGAITCSGDCDADVHGALDSGKSVAALTGSTADGSTYLTVVTQRGGSYSSSDLAGTWALSSIASGEDTPWWSRATLEVEADGDFSGTLRGSDGSTEPISGALSISDDGIVTLADSPSFQCGMDEGTSVVVCTETW